MPCIIPITFHDPNFRSGEVERIFAKMHDKWNDCILSNICSASYPKIWRFGSTSNLNTTTSCILLEQRLETKEWRAKMEENWEETGKRERRHDWRKGGCILEQQGDAGERSYNCQKSVRVIMHDQQNSGNDRGLQAFSFCVYDFLALGRFLVPRPIWHLDLSAPPFLHFSNWMQEAV